MRAPKDRARALAWTPRPPEAAHPIAAASPARRAPRRPGYAPLWAGGLALTAALPDSSVAFLQTGVAGGGRSPEINDMGVTGPESCRIGYVGPRWGWRGVPEAGGGGDLDEGSCVQLLSGGTSGHSETSPGARRGFLHNRKKGSGLSSAGSSLCLFHASASVTQLPLLGGILSSMLLIRS